MDREKVIKGVECHRKKVQTTNAVSCLECPYSEPKPIREWCMSGLMDNIYALLKEQEEERRNIVHWLGKFCAYLDFKDECWSYEQNLAFFRKKMKEQFGWDVADDED